jgi:hypothetical protein
VACRRADDQCRAQDIARYLRDARQDGNDWESRCPLCDHKSFRVSAPERTRWRNIWTCACKGHPKCDGGSLRAELLRLGIRPACLGNWAIDLKPAADTVAAAELRETVDMILNWPGLDPSEMRFMLAEARGDKIPDDYREFARFAQGIGIGRRNSYNLAERNCRPSGCLPPGGGVEDQS